MRSFLRYFLLLLATLAALTYYLPIRYGIDYPRAIGPQFDAFYKRSKMQDIALTHPQIVLVGDSVFMLGVDKEQLAAGTGKTVLGIGVEGSASALWYAIIKNNIVPSPYKPEVLMIVFRDTMLTAPGYRVNGSYFKQLDEYATPDDSLLVERAFVDLMNPLEKTAERYFPLYGSRLKLHETIDHYIRYSGTQSLLGCDMDCTNAAMSIVFGAENMEKNILGDAIGTAESYLYQPHMLDFDRQLEHSFLPEIVRMARENDMQLILVRTKTLRFPDENSEPRELKAYMKNLSAYLDANGVILLDFGQDARLKTEYFHDSLHLNEQGREVFTTLIIDALRSLPMFQSK